jgi:signal transduction histidine kinase
VKSLSDNPRSLLSSQFYQTLVKYTLVPSIPLSIIAILSFNLSTWVTSEIHHFYIELLAVILAAVLAFYYLARAHSLNDGFSLFIGIGFLVNASIDLLHVLVSYIFMDQQLFLKYFIPQTWFVGRIYLSAMLAIAIIKYHSLTSVKSGELSSSDEDHSQKGPILRSRQANKLQKPLLISLILLTLTSAVVAVGSLFFIFPGSVLDNFHIHRPYEIPSLMLLLVALFYFYKNHLYKKDDAFYKGILGSLLIDIFGQIIMSYSGSSFDTAHNVAHVLKDAGYFVNIIGLALSSIQYNASLKESNQKLREREELISTQYKKLKESDKMKDEFINVAAHELRTPIQPILGLTEVLRSKITDTHQQELLDIIIRNAKRSQRLTNDILDVTKIESQSLNLKKELFNLNDVITNAVDDIITNIDSLKNIQQKNAIKLLYRPRDIFIEADKARITQVLSNLLSNAIKFTKARTGEDEGRTVSIVAEDINSEAFVTVKDNGIGIDPEILPKLFEKFASKSYQGTGLGLYISKSIVESHGGRIRAENNLDGNGGATFSFSLPICKDKPKHY